MRKDDGHDLNVLIEILQERQLHFYRMSVSKTIILRQVFEFAKMRFASAESIFTFPSGVFQMPLS